MDKSPPRPDRPQLTLEELQQLRWLLGGVLTLLAVITVAYMDVEAWWVMAPTALAAIATTLWPALPARVPRAVSLLAFPVIAAFFAVDLWLKSELLPAMVRLDMLLLLYRALVYRQKRDDLQVVVLGLFLVVVAGVLTVSLSFAVQILLYTACALLLLLVLTLVDSAQSALPTPPAAPKPTGVPPWAAHVHWGRLLRRVAAALDPRVAVLSAALFLGLIAVSALVFLLIPRFELDNGMFLDRFITKKARTGFSDSIHFGDVTEIQRDTSVALHVDVSDPGQIPTTPYWRMLVLDDYADGTFRMSPALRSRAFEPVRTGVNVYGSPQAHSRARWTVYMESGVSRYLPLLGPFRLLRFAEAQTFQATRDMGLVALTKNPVTMTAFQVEGFELSTRLHDFPDRFYLAKPHRADGSPGLSQSELDRLQQLATAAGGRAATTAAFAASVSAWLRERHAYSLSPDVPAGSGDPLLRWIDSRGAGHCELFAGGFVLLARAAGYPARVVTGFRGGTWNAFSKSFTVRNSDAHAWAEIYDTDSGSWLRADPLEAPAGAEAASGAGAAQAQRTDSSFAARLDSLRVFWYRRVVSFDQQAQIHTLKSAKEGLQAALQRVRHRIEGGASRVTAWWHRPWNVDRWAHLAGVLAGAAALTWLWRRARVLVEAWLNRRNPARREDPVRREAGRWLRRLTASTPPNPADDPVVADLQRLRYGRQTTWPSPDDVFRRARRATRDRQRKSRVSL